MKLFRTNYRKQATLIVRLADLFPECLDYIKPSVRQPPLACWSDGDCQWGKNCMTTLAWRCHALWELFKDAQLILVMFRRFQDGTGSLRAAEIWRDNRQVRVFTVNPHSYQRLMKWGQVFEVQHPMLKKIAPPPAGPMGVLVGDGSAS